METHNTFNTTYRNARQYTLSDLAGSKLSEQATYDKTCSAYRRRVYQAFKQDVCMMFDMDVDTNAWVFDQNELKDNTNGRESLRSLCESVWFNETARNGGTK